MASTVEGAQVQEFTHLHLHSQYSLLDGAIRLKRSVPAAVRLSMDAAALTDHGNMFGAVDFFKKAKGAGKSRSSASRPTSAPITKIVRTAATIT